MCLKDVDGHAVYQDSTHRPTDDGWRVSTKARTISLLLALLVPAGLSAHPGFCKLTVVGTPTLIVDPACPNCDWGSVDIYLRNDNPGPVRLLLTLGGFLNTATGKPFNAAVGPLNPVLVDPEKETKTQPGGKTVGPGHMVLLHVDAWNIVEEGTWKVEMYNRGVDLGSFTVVRSHLPFNVKLDVANPEAAEFRLQWGLRASLPVRNDDDISYPVSLTMAVKGCPQSLGNITLPPHSSAIATISADASRPWFDNPLAGRFKDESVPGTLVVTLLKPPCPVGGCQKPPAGALAGSVAPDSQPGAAKTSDPCPNNSADLLSAKALSSGPSPDAPSKAIKATVTLSYYSKDVQFRAIFLLLLAGALCSLFLSAYLPNQLKRIDLKQQLDALAARVRVLPVSLASTLRVSVGFEIRRCLDLLKSSWGSQPGFSAVLNDVGQRIGTLDKRLSLVEELGRLRLKFASYRARALFPTPMTKAEQGFERTVEVLRKIEFAGADLSAAQSLLKELDRQIEDLEDIEKFCQHQADQVKKITDRATRRLKDIDRDKPDDVGYAMKNAFRHPPPPAAADAVSYGIGLYGNMYKRLHELGDKAAKAYAPTSPAVGAPPTGAPPPLPPEPFLHEDLPDVDRLGIKMEMLLECARLDGPAQAHLKALAGFLHSQNTEEFDAAERLLQEIRERIFEQEVELEITDGAKSGQVVKFRTWAQYARLISSSVVILFVLLAVWFVYCEHWIALALAAFALLVVLSPQLILGGKYTLDEFLARAAQLRDERQPEYAPLVWIADDHKVTMHRGTNEIRVFEPTRLRVRFCKEQFNIARALEDITPIWDFGHDDLTPEEGWEVVHYFPRPGCYRVKVKFQHRLGGFITRAGKSEETAGFVCVVEKIRTQVSESGVSPWALFLHGVWLLVALVPVLLALYTGAMEKLQKLDLTSALIGIFVLGFTSDQVKNLLTQKPR